MATEPFNDGSELVGEFGLTAQADFFDPVLLNDSKVGFSVKRRYPSDIRFKPPLRADGEPDEIAVIWVVYLHPTESDGAMDLKGRVRLQVRIASHSVYRQTHFDYNFDDPMCPTSKSLEKSRRTPHPIALTFDEYMYDHAHGVFLDGDEQISGIEMLNRAFAVHLNTVHPLKGLSIRFKLAMQQRLAGLCSILIQGLEAALKQVFGRTIEEPSNSSGFYRGYSLKNLRVKDETTVSALGYTAPKRAVVWYVIVVGIACALYILCGVKIAFLERILDSSGLTTGFLLFGIIVFESVMPIVVFMFLNLLIKLRTRLLFLRFRV